MNTRQRIVILIGVLIVAGMLLVPPWKENYYAYSSRSGRPTRPTRPSRDGGSEYRAGGGQHAGYGFIFSGHKRFIVGTGERVSGGNVGIDFPRLAVQCLFVAVVTGGLAFALQGRKPEYLISSSSQPASDPNRRR